MKKVLFLLVLSMIGCAEDEVTDGVKPPTVMDAGVADPADDASIPSEDSGACGKCRINVQDGIDNDCDGLVDEPQGNGIGPHCYG